MGLSFAGILSIHFQKFSICLSYGKPYGLLPGGKIFTEVDPSTEDTTKENNSIDNTGIMKI
jgi:hypothetical protein